MTCFFTQTPTAVPAPDMRPCSPLRPLLAPLVLGIALLGVVAQALPAAHADTDSGNGLLGALSSRDISYGSGPAAIAAAHEVCVELDQGKQLSDVANNVMSQTKLDGYHAGFFVGASIAAVCPRHSQ